VLPALVAVASFAISLKLILIPLGILAFLAFLLLLGGFGLISALAIISAVTWLFRLVTGTAPEKGRDGEVGRSRGAFPARGRTLLRK
jgi:hypothetical protein